MYLDTQQEFHSRNDEDEYRSVQHDMYEGFWRHVQELKTVRAAEDYLDMYLDVATTTEYNAVFAAFVGVDFMGTYVSSFFENKSPAREKQLGGGRAFNAFMDYMALVDSLHDFNNIPYPGRKANDYIPVDKIRAALGNPALPAGMEDIDDSRCPIRFTEKMMNMEELDFGEAGTMKNPLWHKRFDPDYEIPAVPKLDPSDNETYFVTNLLYTNAAIKQAERADGPRTIVTEYDDRSKRRILEVQQFAAVGHAMKERFGTDVVFVIDNSDQNLMKLFTGTTNLAKAFYRKYATRPATDFVKEYLHMLGEPINWEAALCDANMLDGCNSGLPRRPEPTGPVFRQGARVQIGLGGVDGNTFGLRVGREPMAQVNIPYHKASSAYIAGKCENEADLAKIATGLAMKRAADWGQVQHCAVYTKKENREFVMVTSDRFASQYAIARNVNVLNLMTRAYDDESFQPVFSRLDFFMFPRDKSPGQTGGGACAAVSAVAAAVLLAAMLLG